MEELTRIDKRVLVTIDSEYCIGPVNHLPEWPEHSMTDLLKSEAKLKRIGFITTEEDGHLVWTPKAEGYKDKHSEEFIVLFKEFRMNQKIPG